MKKILIIEDNKEISENIKEYLELEDFHVSQAFNGDDGIHMATNQSYDLILLDLMLPGVDGIDIARRVHVKKGTPIIMTTARESLGDRLLGFEVGAVDYMVKPFDLSELHARIGVHLGNNSSGKKIGEQETGKMYFRGIDIDLKKHKFIKDGNDIHLTQKEFLIIEKLLLQSDRVVSRSDIIEHLWGGDSLFDGDNKLDVYISNLRSKLGKTFIKTIKGVGYTIEIES